jgi:hypothetical protein
MRRRWATGLLAIAILVLLMASGIPPSDAAPTRVLPVPAKGVPLMCQPILNDLIHGTGRDSSVLGVVARIKRSTSKAQAARASQIFSLDYDNCHSRSGYSQGDTQIQVDFDVHMKNVAAQEQAIINYFNRSGLYEPLEIHRLHYKP